MNLSPTDVLLAAALVLVGLGLYGLVTVRHLIRILVALQILTQGTLLAVAAAGRYSGRMDLAQAMILTAIVADTVITTAGLALAVRVWQSLGTFDLADLAALKG